MTLLMIKSTRGTMVTEGYEQLRAAVGEPIPLGRLLDWAGARLLGSPSALEEPVRGLAIDSRALIAGDLFIALPGEHADGHDFLRSVASKAHAVLVSKPDANLGIAQLVVADVPKALLRIAGGFKRRFPELTVIGITGSVGKTTTKDYLGAILTRFEPSVVSPGNLNTVYGVPLTLARLARNDRLAVVEMGMQRAGEITALVVAAQPRIGVVTAVGPAHLEFFKNIRGIAKAKAELIEGLPVDGTAILPLDCEYYPLLAKSSPCPMVTFGLDEGDCHAGPRVHNSGGSRFEIIWNPPASITAKKSRFEVRLVTPGNHHVRSALRAAAAAMVLGVPPETVVEALAEARTTPLRGEVYRRGGITILADAYNANPLSMSAALETLVGLAGRTVAVLGDMLELGPTASKLHQSVGAEAAERGVVVLIAVGEHAEEIARGARDHGLKEIYEAADRRDAHQILQKVLRPGDVLLLKASRALRLDLLLDGIEKE